MLGLHGHTVWITCKGVHALTCLGFFRNKVINAGDAGHTLDSRNNTHYYWREITDPAALEYWAVECARQNLAFPSPKSFTFSLSSIPSSVLPPVIIISLMISSARLWVCSFSQLSANEKVVNGTDAKAKGSNNQQKDKRDLCRCFLQGNGLNGAEENEQTHFRQLATLA